MTERRNLSVASPAVDTSARLASAWVSRLALCEVTDAEMTELHGWLAVDPTHQDAFDRARRLWREYPQLEQAAGAPVQALSSARHTRLSRPLLWGGAALAASLLLAIVGGSVWNGLSTDYHTATGEVRSVRLPDGSLAWLDTGSALRLYYSNTERRVELVRGRAWFDVRHNAAQPFRVTALRGMASDVGTAFGVRRDNAQVEVSVTRGEVLIQQGGHDTLLAAGQQSSWSAAGTGPSTPRTFEAAVESGWRQGRILLDREPLATALAEIGRYRPGVVLLLDAQKAGDPVSGTLFTAKLDDGLDTLAASEGLQVTYLPYIALVRRAASK